MGTFTLFSKLKKEKNIKQDYAPDLDIIIIIIAWYGSI